MTGWLDIPGMAGLFEDLLTLKESDRGVVLIGAAHVDNHLRHLFEAVLPKDLASDRRRQLLSYPGPLSSFNARVEVAYGTRLIDRRLYDALNALRKIRNEVAHSAAAFQLRGQADRLRQIYALGPGVDEEIPRLAAKILSRAKIDVAEDHERKRVEKEPGAEPLFSNRGALIDYIGRDAEIMEAMRDEVPQIEIAVAVTLICGAIVHHKEKAASLVGDDLTLGQIHQEIHRGSEKTAVGQEPKADQ